MKKIAIQDANILIDLIKTGLFDHCLALNYQFTTTDMILAELHDEQVAVIQTHINSGKFELIEISMEELIEITLLSGEDKRLSEQDWSAVYFAEKKEAMLLSGDKRLRTVADAKKIQVCGIFWILNKLIAENILTETEACFALKELMSKNKRLPLDECNKKIKLWCGE